MNNMKPGALMMLGGGVLLLISSFLNWRDLGFDESGLSTTFTGLDGIFCLLAGIAVTALAAIRAFAADSVKLPDRVLGMSLNQIVLVLGLAAFLMTFGVQFADFVAFGVTLAWIASAVIVVGAFLEEQTSTDAPSAG